MEGWQYYSCLNIMQYLYYDQSLNNLMVTNELSHISNKIESELENLYNLRELEDIRRLVEEPEKGRTFLKLIDMVREFFEEPEEKVRFQELIKFLKGFDEIKELYNLQNPEEVRRFLKDNTFLIEVLLEAPKHIKDYFEYSKLTLEKVTDPEEGEQQLVLRIHTNLPVDEAYKRFEKLLDNWWLDISPNTREKICISY